ncbi:MAG TPA: hypothetical protein VHX17_13690 [Candidatus Cybelea sp.]|jgi:hypothetical protein|nr:hypothetical protein [Candidatus Cybelea sp.]
MISPTRIRWACAAFAITLAAATAHACAQEATPQPVAVASPSPMDREYDGATHVTLAPYIWGPTINANYQFSVPAIVGSRPAHLIGGSVQVTPQQYLTKLNSAGMLGLEVRKGDFSLFGDAIYLNASASASAFSTIQVGRQGRIVIPATFSTDAHLSATMWELAAGYTFAHGHNADLGGFMGIRQFPVNLSISYNATIGRRGLIAPSGTVSSSELTSDVVVGLRGRAFLGNGRWYLPYYADVGSGLTINNQTWEAMGGAGYEFAHGQTLLATYRTLNYNGFPPNQHVQHLSMAGPLLGYTFGF